MSEPKPRRRIAIDLDDTLIDGSGRKRPGANTFLNGIEERGFEPVLYTTSRRQHVDKVLERNPSFKDRFGCVFTSENAPRYGREKIEEAERLGQEGRARVMRLVDDGYAGGKDPGLVGADVLVDDFVDEEVVDQLGFGYVQVRPPKLDSTGSWAIEALKDVDDVLRELQGWSGE